MTKPKTAGLLMDPSTPRSLLDRLADGHSSPAWAEFVTLYTPVLHFWLRPHLLQSADVDDVIQDVLHVVVRKFPEFKPLGPGSFRAWLRTIVAYRLQTFWRNKKRWHAAGGVDGFLSDLIDPTSDLAKTWDLEHDRYVVNGLLATVRKGFQTTTWQAFWRTIILEETTGKVAADLGLTPNAVFIAKSRVLQRLKEEGDGLVGEI